MASNKQRLQGLIQPPPIQRGQPYAVTSPTSAEEVPPPLEATTIQRGPAYTTSLAVVDGPLTPAVLALRDSLQIIARSYIGARRRSGLALLEAARWLSEARVEAQHGEWDDFLEATETLADTAEQLLRIYEGSMAYPALAEAVTTGRVNQSVAERLTRRSTPPTVIDQVLSSARPLKVADVDRVIKAARQGDPVVVDEAVVGGQIPKIMEFEPNDHRVEGSSTLRQLQEAAMNMSELLHQAEAIPAGEETLKLIDQIDKATAAIRRSIIRRSVIEGDLK